MVYQEKNREKWTKDGRSWYFRTYYTNHQDLKKQYESGKYFTKKEAQEAERTFLNTITSHEIEYKNTMFEHVYNEWWVIKKKTLKCTTYYRKKGGADLYILKEFKDYKLSSITSTVLIKWINNFVDKKYSIKYTNEFISYLKQILQYASDNYNYNSKNLIHLQRIRDDSVKEVKSDAEWNYWTNEQFTSFICSVDDPAYNLMFNFLYYTGLRFGEFAALNWNDLDFKEKTLKISKSLSNKVEGAKYIITTPKTENSKRIIDLDDELINKLQNHYSNEAKLYNFSKDMFIFGNVRYIAYTTFTRKLNYYIDKSGINKNITPHGFRHSHVSFLIDIGCDSRDVANRIGDTVEIVEKTYYHMFPKKKSLTVNAINNFKKNMKKQEVNKR